VIKATNETDIRIRYLPKKVTVLHSVSITGAYSVKDEEDEREKQKKFFKREIWVFPMGFRCAKHSSIYLVMSTV
jgi:hypothetical protein